MIASFLTGSGPTPAPISRYVVHRECDYSSDPHPCVANAVPLLVGGLKAAQLHSFSTHSPLAGGGTRTSMHLKPIHMSDYPGLDKNFTYGSSGPDSSEHVELVFALLCSCLRVLRVVFSLGSERARRTSPSVLAGTSGAF